MECGRRPMPNIWTGCGSWPFSGFPRDRRRDFVPVDRKRRATAIGKSNPKPPDAGCAQTPLLKPLQKLPLQKLSGGTRGRVPILIGLVRTNRGGGTVFAGGRSRRGTRGFAGRLGVARRLPAEGAGDVVLKEMRNVGLEETRNVGLEGPARAIEEICPCRHRRQNRQRQHGCRISKAKKPTSHGSQRDLSHPRCGRDCNIERSPRRACRPPIPPGKYGGCSRIRTYDPLIKSQLLYQLSYAPIPRRNRSPRVSGGL